MPKTIRCPKGKERNPFTKRCVNKCKDGYRRRIEKKTKKFDCVKIKTSVKSKKIPNDRLAEIFKNSLYDKLRIEKNTNSLVIGDVQSGKTDVMIGYCYKSKKLGKRVLYLVRNMTSDAEQLQERFQKFTEEFPKISKEFPIQVRRINEYSGKKKMESLDADVIICLMNPKSISNFELLVEKFGFEFNICVDESDLISGEEGTSEKSLKRLRDNPKRFNFLAVTATPIATVFNMNINFFYKLPRSIHYTHIEHPRIQWLSTFPTSSKDYELDLENMNHILRTGLQKKICIALMVTTIENKKQKSILESLLITNPKYVGIIYNQNTLSILRNVQGMIRNVRDNTTINEAITNAISLGKHIVILAGKKADRGISFVSQDYKYHLTDLYLRSDENPTIHCESLIQRLRILGKYTHGEPDKGENKIFKTERESKLCIWSTEELKDEILDCYFLIQKLTNKLVEFTERGNKIVSKTDINRILEELKFKKGELPRIPLVKKRHIENIIFDKAAKVKNQIIKYDKEADGYCLKNPTGNFCKNPTQLKCNEDRDLILKELGKFLGKDFSSTSIKKHLYGYFYENTLLPENRDEIEDLRQVYLRTKDVSDLRKYESSVKRNCKQFVEQRILGENLKNYSSQLKQYIETKGLSLNNFSFKSYIGDNVTKSKLAFKNRRLQIEKHLETKKTEEFEITVGKPFDFSIGKILDDMKIPLVFTFFIPYDFKYDGVEYKSGIKENDILYWQNLQGMTYVNVVNSKSLLKDYINAGEFIFQKIEDEKSLSNSNSNNSNGAKPYDPLRTKLKNLHRRLLKMSSNDLNKGKENEKILKEYHELRDKYWLKDEDPINEVIKRLEGVYEEIKNEKIADMGCGNAKLARHFGKKLNISSFDHFKINDFVTPVNMKNTGQKDKEFDKILFCLSISWGNSQEINDYLDEGLRICKEGGIIDIICTAADKDVLENILRSDYYDRITKIDSPVSFSGKYFHISCKGVNLRHYGV